MTTSSKRPDCLVDVEEVISVFDVEHVFPQTFIKEEKRDGWWTRMRRWIASCFGYGKGAAQEVRGEPGDAEPGGREDRA